MVDLFESEYHKQADLEDWVVIPDDEIFNVWVKQPDDECGQGPDSVEIPPTFYEESGTPVCWCGMDMVYSHTIIKKKK